ncbi:unnamed protein product [Peronospora belbahrii]|uniref:Phasin domain-containing protein n=1 Tax=Peronospora belbahrii TaxID=622444 RepID=A0ABN8DB46_9STRA|nr:unnamed protein product [Peronospora belbahrii]
MGISDHTPTKSSRTTQEEVSKLQELMKSGANDAATYLESLKNKFADYDKSHNSPKDSATSYFQAAMDRAHASVEMLKNAGENVRADGNSVSDSVVDSAKRAVDQTGSALDDLGKSAQSYDQHSIASLVTSTRESTFQGFEALQTHLAAMQTSVAEYASAAADSISNTASDASEKLKPADANPSLMQRASGAVSSSVDYVTSPLQGSK